MALLSKLKNTVIRLPHDTLIDVLDFTLLLQFKDGIRYLPLTDPVFSEWIMSNATTGVSDDIENRSHNGRGLFRRWRGLLRRTFLRCFRLDHVFYSLVFAAILACGLVTFPTCAAIALISLLMVLRSAAMFFNNFTVSAIFPPI